MSGFDTSGAVTLAAAVVIGQGKTSPLTWSDLNPFTQGYVEALFASAEYFVEPAAGPLGFSDLAPETLARIMEDCGHAANVFAGLGFKTGAIEGARFWHGRNNGSLTGVFRAAYPPQTAYLSDDGKVCLRDAPSPSSDRGGS